MKRILYIANNSDMVMSKINAQKYAFEMNGYECDIKNEKYTFKSVLALKGIINNYDIVYIRYDIRFILLSILWFYLFKNKYVILEIPTPISAVRHEIKLLKVSVIKKILHIYIKPFLLFFALCSSNLIIEYADDNSKVIRIFKDKILLMQNGINDVDMYKLPENYFSNTQIMIDRFVKNKELHILFVANLQESHGLERLIFGLGDYYKNQNTEYKVNLSIIAPENILLSYIKGLVSSLDISKYVTFLGKQEIYDLHKYYINHNVGLGSIATFKVGLLNASPLKIKEYAFFGLPSIIDYYDYDLSDKEYILQVTSDNSYVDIKSLIDFYSILINKYGYDMPNIIHEYALKYLTWNSKIAPVINKINENLG